MRLATGNTASVIGNHSIPVLQWLHFEDLTFAIFPFLLSWDSTLIYLYEDTKDILDTVLQLCEVSSFALREPC